MPGRRRIGWLAAAVVLVAAGCWEQPGFDAGGSGSSGMPVGVSAANVGSLEQVFSAPSGAPGHDGHAVISGGHLFVTQDRLASFDAGGSAGCAGVPKTCAPQWRSAETLSFTERITIGGGLVWATTASKIVGYDVAGERGCGGTPRICSPVVTIPIQGSPGGLRWIGDAIHATVTTGTLHNYYQWHYAFGADGVERWRSDVGGPLFAPFSFGTVGAGGLAYVGLANGTVAAFDASGVNGCSGVPKVCSPLWTMSGSVGFVAGERFYANQSNRIAVFDARGVAGCSGVPKVCGALWSTSGGAGVAAVTGDRLYVGAQGLTDVYSLGGAGCSGTPLVCDPLWKNTPASSPYGIFSLSVAGGVVYTSTVACTGGDCTKPLTIRVDAHDATGTLGCAGVPKVCTHRWTRVMPFDVDATLVVGDTVFVVGKNSVGAPTEVRAFRPTSS